MNGRLACFVVMTASFVWGADVQPAKPSAAKPSVAKPSGATKAPSAAAPAAKKPGTTASPAGFEQASTEAGQAREANRVEDAIQLYKKALKLKPSWDEGWWWLGTLYYDTDRYPEAAEAFRRVTTLRPQMGQAFAFLGLCEFQTKAFDNAVMHLEHGRALGLGDNPQFISVVMYHNAILLTRYEQFEPAAKLLMETARRTTCNPNLVEAIGIVALRRGVLPSDLPADQKEKALKLGHAVCLASIRNGPEARKEFDEVVPAYASDPNVHYAYGTFLLAGDPDAALAEFQKTLDLDPKHLPALVSVAFEFMRRGEPEKAVPFGKTAVEQGPKSFATHATLGRALVESGKVEEGVRELEVAERLAPDSPQVRIALASAYAKVGRKEDAARERAEFMKLKKQMGDTGIAEK